MTGAYAPIDRSLPDDYPAGNKRLIKQSIVNLKYYLDSEDYSQYVFPALRALEGHIKYLLTVAGRTAKRNFDCFNLDTSNTPLTPQRKILSKTVITITNYKETPFFTLVIYLVLLITQGLLHPKMKQTK